jgi:hypothetical protein
MDANPMLGYQSPLLFTAIHVSLRSNSCWLSGVEHGGEGAFT